MAFPGPVPEIPAANVDKAAADYVNTLGFTLDWGDDQGGLAGMLVRREGLAETMSRYFVRRIEDNPAIVVHTRTELDDLEDDGHLERVRWRDTPTGAVETEPIRHLFPMTGAVPNTGWLNGCVALDDKGPRSARGFNCRRFRP